MQLSLFLAKVIGLLLMLVSAALLVRRKNVVMLFQIYSKPQPVFFTGILEVVLGLLFVLSHNIWTWDFRGVITFIGWILLFRGLGRVFFPKRVARWVGTLKKVRPFLTSLLIFVFLVGLYLAYMGFTIR